MPFRPHLLEDGRRVDSHRVVAACGQPWPFSVNTCSSTGPGWSLTSREIAAQRRQVVAVDRADVAEAQFLEQHAAVRTALRPSRDLLERRAWPCRRPAASCASSFADLLLGALVEVGQPGRSRYSARPPTRGQIDILLSLRMTSRFLLQTAGVVRGLEDDARRQGPVADHGHAVAVLAGRSRSSPTFRPRRTSRRCSRRGRS